MLRNAYRRFVMLLGDLLTFLYVRKYEVVGQENVPPAGAIIVASNHLNAADPPFVTRALGRPPIFMAKKEMLDLPLFGLAFRAWGAFPVRRGEFDLAAIRAAVDVLQRGEVLLMFPEGTRSRTGGLGRGHPGTATIALHTGAPILPVAITGTENVKWPWFLLRPLLVRHVRVVIGEPFHLAEVQRVNREAARQATDIIMLRIAGMLPPEYRGVYASRQA
jgi:1-acyl-sn-glycerol-3-phosphate acyltransferase